MNDIDFRQRGHELVDWMSDYLQNIESYPVKSQVSPGDILKRLPEVPPNRKEGFEAVMKDFEEIVIPGMTHWQSPNFFAYFPSSNSRESILAEMLTATLGAQCMMWVTSPAAAELEQRMTEWLRIALRLPEGWSGVIQDTASTATLCAILSAREAITNFHSNYTGFQGGKYRIYCSEQAHSSVDKAAALSGVGRDNLVKIEVDEAFALKANKLEEAINRDLRDGFKPLCIVGALGTTGTTAIDPIDKMGEIASMHNIWFHVDAAYAGSALVIDDFRNQFERLDLADSFVFNPHKWMFTNFDCSVYYAKNKETLIKTFSLTPEYLKTKEEDLVNNYKDWGIQLGRRFRALKLWFVIRLMGLDGIKARINEHIRMGRWLENQISEHPDFELLAPVSLNMVSFRWNTGQYSLAILNELNERLMESVNATGRIYITHTRLNDRFTLRLVPAQADVSIHHVQNAWKLIQDCAGALKQPT